MKTIDFQSTRLCFALFLCSAVCFQMGNTAYLSGGKVAYSCFIFLCHIC